MATDLLFEELNKKHCDIQVCSDLLKAGADIKSRRHGMFGTPLLYAVDKGHVDAATLLLKKGANPNERNHATDDTLLMYAAKKGNNDIIKVLITHGADVNASNKKNGHTPLTHAITQGHTDTIALLLDHGADPNFRNALGWSPLIHAVIAQKPAAAMLLLDRRADIGLATYRALQIGLKQEVEILRDIERQYNRAQFQKAAEKGTTRPRNILRRTPPQGNKP